MEDELKKFIDTARSSNMSDADIKQKLLSSGWIEVDVDRALRGEAVLEVPKPPSAPSPPPAQPAVTHGYNETAAQPPVPVVENMTTRGIEYNIMFISLWVSAIAFGGLLHDLIDMFSGNEESYPHVGGIAAITAIIVCFPILAYLFIRLKNLEFTEPGLRKDPSRRKVTQSTIVFSFIIGVLNLIWMVYLLLSGGGTSDEGVDSAALFMHTLVTIAICGGIFGYYWRDIHRE